MGIVAKIRGVINPDYKYDDAAKAKINKSSKAAYYQAKEVETVRFAKEKAKIEVDNRLKKLREPPKQFSMGSFNSPGLNQGGLMNAFGGPAPHQQQPQLPRQRMVRVKRISYRPVRRGGRTIYKKVTSYTKSKRRVASPKVQAQAPQRYNVLSGGAFDVLGGQGKRGWGI